ncbi:hypothetical protein M422DRAFT_175378 [Sphaerobolus stellatus SS14]|uniref:Unplaced genomic scaffold SPHSTscaffold_78, whole genome shotgun sequence n=1 Tax=Sphaerobolus stellatus (strain SS14) TaxID=990650 RepID=A0A0C9UWU4_SPHS4|nr:hypothetical protein M422DRAFT_175378 [Sphaerobolus stellatus SS14]
MTRSLLRFIPLPALVLALAAFQLARAHEGFARSAKCKALPSDASWPATKVWDSFNSSVNGRLIRTVPIGTPCHGSHFNQTECAFVRNNWHETSLHLPSSSSMMTPLFANESCDPFTASNAQCVIGTYVQYAVNVSEVDDIRKTLNFSRTHNIRFVVRNTGHDYMGKSTGTGGLSVWTRHLQETQWIPKYSSSFYTGPAIKAQAGVSVEQMYKIADENGHVIIGGDCSSVGYTGGYIQGGGHSTLSSFLGLAADSALEYEVVTTTGKFVVASPTQNSDLYWALSGGGGGSYGIVWSVTVKAHPNFPVVIANVSFTSANITQDLFWQAIASYQAITPALADAGTYAMAVYGSASFELEPVFVPNATIEQVQNLIKPFLSNLTAFGINHTVSITSHPTFQIAFDSVPEYVDLTVGIYNFGGRILPKSLWEDPGSFNRTMAVLRGIANNSGTLMDLTLSPSIKLNSAPPNAVLPAWRTAQKFLITLLPWNDTATAAEIKATQNRVTNIIDQPLRDLAPDSGTYLNEADPNEPNWQQSFYGANYQRLLSIKDKWDPEGMLFGRTAVGGDRWFEDADGRLCRVLGGISLIGQTIDNFLV